MHIVNSVLLSNILMKKALLCKAVLFQLDEFYYCTYLGFHETGKTCHKARA